MWVHSNPLMSHAGVTFISPPVVTPPPVAKSVSFTGYITMLWVRPLEMCLDPYKNWIQVDPVFEFLKLLLCCDVALSSPHGSVDYGSTLAMRCVQASCSAVNKLITHGTTPAVPCWGSCNKTRVTRLRKLVNTQTCHVLHSYQFM